MSIYLGIDYGTKRVGLALATTLLAEPLVILPQDAQIFAQLYQRIVQHQVTDVVVGVSEGEMAERSQQFGNELLAWIRKKATADKHTFSLPRLHFADETLSSYEVHQQRRALGHKDGNGPIDHFAAAHLLQEYLDLHQMSISL